MPQLFFLRHAESESNVSQEYAAQTSVPITQRGHQEASETAKLFKLEFNIHKIYCSNLYRALQTASYFEDQCKLPLIESELIVEQHLGDFTGKSYEEANRSPYFEKDVHNRWNWVPPGQGESYSMIADRILKFFKMIENEPEDENILIVTHGVALRLIKGVLENTLPRYNTGLVRNCEIIKTQFKQIGEPHQWESVYYLNPQSSKSHGV